MKKNQISATRTGFYAYTTLLASLLLLVSTYTLQHVFILNSKLLPLFLFTHYMNFDMQKSERESVRL